MSCSNHITMTAEVARQLLRYEPDTGKLFWLERPREFSRSDLIHKSWNTKFSGMEAFLSLDHGGYLRGTVLYRTYIAHRIAWLIMTGDWPSEHIDHKNGIRTDNRWNNLRDVSRTINMRNTKINSRNTSGFNGVSWNKSERKWSAFIRVRGRQIHLGRFSSIDEAIATRAAANLEHGFTERHGVRS